MNDSDLIIEEYRNEIDYSADADYILEHYFMQYEDNEQLVNALLDLKKVSIPTWLSINYDLTWEKYLRFDFNKTTNYIFYK